MKISSIVKGLSVGEAIEGLVYVNSLWEEIVGERELKAFVRTDNRTLSIKSSTGVSSKRLKIDIVAIRETIDSGEISEVQWIQGNHQVADVLTKSGVLEENIRDYLEGTEIYVGEEMLKKGDQCKKGWEQKRRK